MSKTSDEKIDIIHISNMYRNNSVQVGTTETFFSFTVTT